MELKSNLESLHQIYSFQKFEVTSSDYAEFEKKLCFFDRLAEVENSSVTVLDMYKKRYIFLRSRFTEKFDNPLIEHNPDDPFYYTQFVPPEDLKTVIDAYRRSFFFILTLPQEERKDYKLIMNFRQRDKYGNYLNVILQLVVLELDKKGNIWLVLILDDLLPDKISFNGVNRRLINIKTGKICLFNDEIETKQKAILSTREIEVLGLVSKGFVSKEIADRLFLSVNTVNNHRQNILEKINATNTSEAVSYARNIGLL
jgi:DNA-binding CsgD family transcriptional regulator